MESRDELIRLLRPLIKDALPEIGEIPYCVKGRVVKVHAAGVVDVRILARDGSLDEKAPVLPMLELPSGAGLVHVGNEVRVGFYYNDPATPYVDAVLGG